MRPGSARRMDDRRDRWAVANRDVYGIEAINLSIGIPVDGPNGEGCSAERDALPGGLLTPAAAAGLLRRRRPATRPRGPAPKRRPLPTRSIVGKQTLTPRIPPRGLPPGADRIPRRSDEFDVVALGPRPSSLVRTAPATTGSTSAAPFVAGAALLKGREPVPLRRRPEATRPSRRTTLNVKVTTSRRPPGCRRRGFAAAGAAISIRRRWPAHERVESRPRPGRARTSRSTRGRLPGRNPLRGRPGRLRPRAHRRRRRGFAGGERRAAGHEDLGAVTLGPEPLTLESPRRDRRRRVRPRSVRCLGLAPTFKRRRRPRACTPTRSTQAPARLSQTAWPRKQLLISGAARPPGATEAAFASMA